MNQYFLADNVTPEQMDLLWENGWRHFGEYFFRYSEVAVENGQRHVVPLRIQLADFELSRGQKRIWKRNQDLEVVIRPAFIDEAKVRLFEIHKVRFSENVPDSLYTFLSAEPARVPCSCLEVCLFKKGELIGASFMDLGRTSTSSVYSVFDPAHSSRSLGVFLILLSIKWSREHGKALYYPGYAYREPSHYDYKKRFSSLEEFNWTEWKEVERFTDV